HSATSASYTLSLHDALPILKLIRPPDRPSLPRLRPHNRDREARRCAAHPRPYSPSRGQSVENSRAPPPRATIAPARLPSNPKSRDRKSTRLNSSHLVISYAV